MEIQCIQEAIEHLKDFRDELDQALGSSFYNGTEEDLKPLSDAIATATASWVTYAITFSSYKQLADKIKDYRNTRDKELKKRKRETGVDDKDYFLQTERELGPTIEKQIKLYNRLEGSYQTIKGNSLFKQDEFKTIRDELEELHTSIAVC